jgi:hypothetical protein
MTLVTHGNRASLVSFSVAIYLQVVLTIDITIECTLVVYWFNPLVGMHKVLGSIPSLLKFCFQCMYKYIPSTYNVQTKFVPVRTCNDFVITWLAQCWIGTYQFIIQLVTVHTTLYIGS